MDGFGELVLSLHYTNRFASFDHPWFSNYISTNCPAMFLFGFRIGADGIGGREVHCGDEEGGHSIRGGGQSSLLR